MLAFLALVTLGLWKVILSPAGRQGVVFVTGLIYVGMHLAFGKMNPLFPRRFVRT